MKELREEEEVTRDGGQGTTGRGAGARGRDGAAVWWLIPATYLGIPEITWKYLEIPGNTCEYLRIPWNTVTLSRPSVSMLKPEVT